MNRSDDPPRSGKNFPRAWMEITEGVNAPKHAYSRSSRTGSSSPVIPSATSPRLSSSPIPRLFSAMKCSSSPSPPSPSDSPDSHPRFLRRGQPSSAVPPPPPPPRALKIVSADFLAAGDVVRSGRQARGLLIRESA